MKFTRMYRPKTIVFDIDGTLVDTSHIQHYLIGEPADFDQYNEESYLSAPIDWVVEHAKEARRNGVRVLQLTARNSKYRVMTAQWLSEHQVPSDALYMRNRTDERSDYDVKKDYIELLLKSYDIQKAFDDKPEIVALWQEYDIPCIRVYPPVLSE